MLGYTFADAPKAGAQVQFGFNLAIAFADVKRAGIGECDAGDRCSALRGADLGIVTKEADERDCVFDDIYVTKILVRRGGNF